MILWLHTSITFIDERRQVENHEVQLIGAFLLLKKLDRNFRDPGSLMYN